MLSVKDVVERLDLGKSVAESDDEALFQNFIETGAYKRMRGGESDIVIGNKGTGKTSIYRKLASDAEALRGESIFLVESFDAVGQSNFQAITDIEPLEEAEYKNIWKLYIYALGAQVVVNEGPALDVDKNDLKSIVLTLKALGLERNVLGPKRKNPLTKLVQSITGRFKGIGFRGRISANIPIMGTVEAEIEGLESLDEEDGSYFINIDDALGTLSDTLENLGYCGWFVMDRLDEAFQGQGEIEKLALRALLRTYLDLNDCDCLSLKLFMRRDLFDRVTGENFVNLTHVNAKREELEWDDKDLEQVLCSRVRRGLGQEVQDVVGDSNGAILHFLFPEKVEPREKQSKSWKWVNDRTRDGVSGSPRNLIDYVELAKKEKLKVLERDSEDCDYPSWNIDVPLLSGDIMKTALRKLSDMRVKDTLLAESGSFRSDIEKFRQGKTEHDLNSLSEIFGDRRIEVRDYLVSIGFFERYGDSYKVMFLYRDGLSMTQGKDPRMASS